MRFGRASLMLSCQSIRGGRGSVAVYRVVFDCEFMSCLESCGEIIPVSDGMRVKKKSICP